MYCKELDVKIREYDDSRLITNDGVFYRKDEAILLARECVDDLRTIHKIKKLFEGEYVDKPKPNPHWRIESEAVKALWDSRLYGVPPKPVSQIRKKRINKNTENVIQGELWD